MANASNVRVTWRIEDDAVRTMAPPLSRRSFWKVKKMLAEGWWMEQMTVTPLVAAS